MNNALIGHTGFVGGNLFEQHAFSHCYNSKNFREMSGRRFDEVVCAGVSAVKWIANREPGQDRENIRQLEAVLSRVEAERFVLISTIDVYPDTSGRDESFDCASLPNNAYGTHRLEFEQFCSNRFQDCYIVRLPGLFGKGLKKNVIYDLLNHNCLDMINPASSFQYYDLSKLWLDIETVIGNELHLVNLFTEPVTTQTVIDRFFSGTDFDDLAANPAPEVHYALKTRHAEIWGGHDGYIASEASVLKQMEKFIDHCRASGNR
jgi:hypothetical protein